MRAKLPLSSRACPCGSEALYTACCGVWHAGYAQGVHAATAGALMRSRYSAYALGLTDYLLATWHPSSSPGALELFPIKWLGLDVLNAEQSADAGVVEFVARFRSADQGGRAQRMHEISRFVLEQGRWLYIDGEPVREAGVSDSDGD
jgi:SEC-C motif-containing protein